MQMPEALGVRVAPEPGSMRRVRACRAGSLPWLWAALLTLGADSALAERPALRDPEDGAFDLSAWLDTAYGFVPIVVPITEPAVGYGATAALIFIDRNEPAGGKPVRPNLAAVGALATENGTSGYFGGHVGNWKGGRLRTVVALADADVNLEFFGLGQHDSGTEGNGLDYTIGASGGVAGASYRPWSTPLWLGARYAVAETTVRARGNKPDAAVDPADRDLRLAAVTPHVTFDSRDNSFTATRGLYLDVSAPLFREDFGSDRDFELLKLSAQYFHPLGDAWFGGVRAGWRDSSDGTPFYLRPYVTLRGVPAMRYQGEKVAEAEAEVRWQWRPRWSAVAFGGTGTARTESNGDESVAAGGVGFRYVIARTYGLHMGLDVAWGPDDPVLYVVFGSAWLRP